MATKWIGLLGASAVLLSSSIASACFPRKRYSADEWAARIVSRSDVIMFAEVVREQNVPKQQGAQLRVRKLFKGARASLYNMALPVRGGVVVTHMYPGFPDKKGTRTLVALAATDAGYQTSVCTQLYLQDDAVRKTVLRTAKAD